MARKRCPWLETHGLFVASEISQLDNILFFSVRRSRPFGALGRSSKCRRHCQQKGSGEGETGLEGCDGAKVLSALSPSQEHGCQDALCLHCLLVALVKIGTIKCETLLEGSTPFRIVYQRQMVTSILWSLRCQVLDPFLPILKWKVLNR